MSKPNPRKKGYEMKVLHKETIIESRAIAQLCNNLDKRSESWENQEAIPDLETFEKGLHGCIMEIERELVAEELKRYDVIAEAV